MSPNIRMTAPSLSLERGEIKHLIGWIIMLCFHSFDGWTDISYILAMEWDQKLSVETQAEALAPMILLLWEANWKASEEVKHQQ